MTSASRSTYAALGLAITVALSGSSVRAFHTQAAGWSRGQVSHDTTAARAISNFPQQQEHQEQLDLPPTSTTSRRRTWMLRASPKNKSADHSVPSKKSGSNSDSNNNNDGSSKRRKVSVQAAMKQWAFESLSLARFNVRTIHVCKATTLPGVLSAFWELTADHAHERYQALKDDTEYNAHLLFVAPRCSVLKDYGMMRHLDKVVDFCGGGCTDFGRTMSLQHYHPDFWLPPAQTVKQGRRGAKDAPSPSDVARAASLSKSPYPAFGLTVNRGDPARSDPTQPLGKVARYRSDLEVLYNSMSGCSTEDNVDAHGSEHGVIPSDPEIVMEKTLQWFAASVDELERLEEVGEEAGYWALRNGEDFIISNARIPEEVFSEVWSIVGQLQEEVNLFMAADTPASSRTSHAHGDAVEGDQGVNAASATMSAIGKDGGVVGEGEALASKMLVTPRINPFNAALYKNLARSLGIALKQTPIMDRIELEIYHPEYVADSGGVNSIRRSPFPTLLIKHCGLKDQLYEPRGLYSHSAPPIQIPLDALEAAAAWEDDGTEEAAPPEVSTNGAHI